MYFSYGKVETEYLKSRDKRLSTRLGVVNPETVSMTDIADLQSVGMTFRKAEYIRDFAEKVHSGNFDLDTVAQLPDEQAINALSSLKGIGGWTAEMILLFCLQRPNVLSYDDLAIQRGLWQAERYRK